MKAFYLILSIILTALILVISFGNIGASCSQLYFLFFPVQTNPTIIIMTIAVIGIFTGAFYHAFLSRIFSGGEDEESDEF